MRYYLCAFVLLYIINSLSYASTLVLSNVPEYYWWHGCSPTASGMIVGYWDTQGYDMIPGNAMDASGLSLTDFSNDPAAQNVRDIITSPDHISGTPHSNDSLSDFMNTTYPGGSTSRNAIGPGMEDFAAWDNPNIAGNDSMSFTSVSDTTLEFGGGTLDFQAVVDEINAGRPYHLSVELSGGGHSVVAYGYEDNTGTNNDWFAVRDTWTDGIGGAYSQEASAKLTGSTEWWRWITTDVDLTYHIEEGRSFVPDTGGPGAPEPGSLLLFGFGALGLLRRKKKADDAL